MNKLVTTILLLALAGYALNAQNLNPKVEVTNAYEGEAMEVSKQDVAVNIPDSLTNFNLDLDYSVFPQSYKGSYEFHPYLVNMIPDKQKDESNVFYAKVGAGYTFNPEATIVWSPRSWTSTSFNMYDHFDGYWGNYYNTYSDAPSQAIVGNAWDNFFGVSVRDDKRRRTLSFDGGIDFLGAQKGSLSRNYKAFDLNFRLKSHLPDTKGFFYDARVAAIIGMDNLNFASLYDIEMDLGLLLGYAFSPRSSLELDLIYKNALYSQYFNSGIADIGLVPHYVFKSDKAKASLGVKIDFVTRKQGEFGMFTQTPQLLSPDIDLSYNFFNGGLTLFAGLTGGNQLNTYSSIIRNDRVFNTVGACKYYQKSPVIDNTVEVYNASAGIRGSIASRLQYNIHGGYASYRNYMMEGIFLPSTSSVMGSFIYGDCKLPYAEGELVWNSERIKAEAKVSYKDVRLTEDVTDVLQRAVLPSKFTASASLQYNWSKRFYAGVNCSYGSERTYSYGGFNLPSFVDLGADLEYIISPKFSVWLSGSNLLNQEIYRHVLAAQKGFIVTAGICLKL